MDVTVGPASAGRSRTSRLRGIAPALLAALLVSTLALLAAQRLSDSFTPSNAVLGWYRALASGDAGAAWTGADYGKGPLLSRPELAAMLAQPANRDWTGVRVLEARQDAPAHYLVTVGYRHAGRQETAVLGVRREAWNRSSLFSYWRVEVTPARLTLAGFAPGGRLTVDGLPADPALLASGAAVIPGRHLLAETATGVTDATRLPVEAAGTLTATLHPAVPRAVQQDARALLEDAFSGCARSGDLHPGGCPFSAYRMGDVVSDVTWTEEGDQLAGAAFGPGAEAGLVSVTGSWRMRVAYDYAYLGLEDWPEHREVDEGGRWHAVFRKAAAGLQLVSFEGS